MLTYKSILERAEEIKIDPFSLYVAKMVEICLSGHEEGCKYFFEDICKISEYLWDVCHALFLEDEIEDVLDCIDSYLEENIDKEKIPDLLREYFSYPGDK